MTLEEKLKRLRLAIAQAEAHEEDMRLSYLVAQRQVATLQDDLKRQEKGS